ncbi:MAG: hypothetical protein JO211_05995 [Acidobacteriaceae bacterium]|nr:hypothetical protein [Acidobacteriaceae bacterium]
MGVLLIEMVVSEMAVRGKLETGATDDRVAGTDYHGGIRGFAARVAVYFRR